MKKNTATDICAMVLSVINMTMLQNVYLLNSNAESWNVLYNLPNMNTYKDIVAIPNIKYAVEINQDSFVWNISIPVAK